MTFSKTSGLMMLAIILAACGSAEPPAEPARPVKKETVFDPLTGTLDRAKGVQQTVDEQAAEQRRKLEAAEK